MRIEIELTEAPGMVPPELWMRVLSDKFLDWPDALGHLSSEQSEDCAGYDLTAARWVDGLGFYDHEGPDHDFAFEDYWIFSKRNEG